ncbi:MAG: hypothetical protein AB3X44_06550 [Leptothrix sp. (in: b-proteobacteria)]
MKSIDIISLIFVLCPSFSQAFEVNGFVSGMTENQALKLLRERNDRVSLVGGGSDIDHTYLGASQGSSTTEAISACRGQLKTYQYDISGGMRAFVRMVQSEQIAFGPGVAEAVSRETKVGEWSSVKFTWVRRSDQKEIVYSFISSEQVYIRYSDQGAACQ